MAKQQKTKPIEFLKLELNKPISGKFKEFRKNRYGLYLLFTNNTAISIKAAVLKSLLKEALPVINDNSNIEITKMDKAKGKSYYNYSLVVDDKEIIIKNTIDKNEIINYL